MWEAIELTLALPFVVFVARAKINLQGVFAMTAQNSLTAPHQVRAALRAKHAAEYLGIGLSTIWHRAKTDPDFPQPTKLGPRTTVWFTADLDAFLADQARGQA